MRRTAVYRGRGTPGILRCILARSRWWGKAARGGGPGGGGGGGGPGAGSVTGCQGQREVAQHVGTLVRRPGVNGSAIWVRANTSLTPL